jgi:thiamine monophosphate synthase
MLILGCDFEQIDTETSNALEDWLSGLQLRGDPSLATLRRARARWPEACLGRSCHGAPQPGHAWVDYTAVAPIHPPRTGTDASHKQALGTEALARWCAETSGWIVALGGIEPKTARPCLDAGARGLASIRCFFGDPGRVAEDVEGLCSALAADRDVSPTPR